MQDLLHHPRRCERLIAMGRYRIVLADDHALFRQGLRRIIEDNPDLEIAGEAGDGMALLSLVEAQNPDLAVVDISMPKLRGVDLVRKIKAERPATKVLILSMHKEYLHQAVSAGADGYLLKEDADRELFRAIESIRQNRQYITSRLTETMAREREGASEALSGREMMVLKLIAEGRTNRDVAEELFISVRTVESHRASILRKLQMKNTADLVRYAIEHGYC